MNELCDQVWQDFLKILQDEVGARVVETWIKAVTISRYDAGTGAVYISAPNSFVKNWVEAHYKNLFYLHLKRLFGKDDLKILFGIESVQPETEFVEKSETSKIVPAVAVAKQDRTSIEKKLPTYRMNTGRLNSLYTFDTFVVGENNSFAYASSQAVIKKLGSLYNPLLLYGESGLGKTHLLHAIGNELLQKYSNIKVLYQTTDRFITEFINAIRFDQVAKFQIKYKNVDVLLMDDIQFMINKEQTQEAFFHIFNNLYDMNKQIVLSSDTLPRHLGGLADRLKSRLEWGLVADVQVPMFETKMAILKRKAEMQQECLPDEVAEYIAQQDIKSVRELEGSLIRVLAYVSLTDHVISIGLVKKVLGFSDNVTTEIKKVDFSIIISLIEKYFSYNLTVLRSKDRSKGISHARQVAMYLMKKKTEKSLREIGEYFDRKDHTTITHAIQRIKTLSIVDKDFYRLLSRIEKELH